MAKIATAHIEIKPVIDEAAFTELCSRIEEGIRAAVQRGMSTTSLPWLAPPNPAFPNIWYGTKGQTYTTTTADPAPGG